MQQRSFFMSLRTKLLLVFTGLFLIAFAGIWRWFYLYATDRTMSDLHDQLMSAAITAADGIDGAVHTKLVTSGKMDDAQYHAIADWLRSVKRSNPKLAGVYTYYQPQGEVDQVRFGVSARLPPGETQDPDNPALPSLQKTGCTDAAERPTMGQVYGKSDGLTPDMLAGLQVTGSDPGISTDQWGSWLSGYAPIKDKNGVAVGAVGVDMCAVDVARLQQNIQSHMEIAFGVALVLLIAGVTLVAYRITRPVMALTGAANQIAAGDYGKSVGQLFAGRVKDEVSTLSEVFDLMVSKVRTREESLRRQVTELQIIIDETKSQKEVEEITDTDFFRDLQQRAEDLRKRRARGPLDPEATD